MTVYRLDPDAPAEAPERVLLAVRVAGTDDYLFARWPDWPHPAMLSLTTPVERDPLDGAAADLVWARLRLRTSSGPVLAAERLPVRMTHPRTGGHDVGWLRPARVEVTIDGPDAAPDHDALLESVERLSLPEALEALPTDLERRVLRLAAETLG